MTRLPRRERREIGFQMEKDRVANQPTVEQRLKNPNLGAKERTKLENKVK